MVESSKIRGAGIPHRYRHGFGRAPGEKRLLGRPIRRWEVNIIVDLQEMGWEGRTGLIWLRTGTGGGPF